MDFYLEEFRAAVERVYHNNHQFLHDLPREPTSQVGNFVDAAVEEVIAMPKDSPGTHTHNNVVAEQDNLTGRKEYPPRRDSGLPTPIYTERHQTLDLPVTFSVPFKTVEYKKLEDIQMTITAPPLAGTRHVQSSGVVKATICCRGDPGCEDRVFDEVFGRVFGLKSMHTFDLPAIPPSPTTIENTSGHTTDGGEMTLVDHHTRTTRPHTPYFRPVGEAKIGQNITSKLPQDQGDISSDLAIAERNDIRRERPSSWRVDADLNSPYVAVPPELFNTAAEEMPTTEQIGGVLLHTHSMQSSEHTTMDWSRLYTMPTLGTVNPNQWNEPVEMNSEDHPPLTWSPDDPYIPHDQTSHSGPSSSSTSSLRGASEASHTSLDRIYQQRYIPPVDVYNFQYPDIVWL